MLKHLNAPPKEIAATEDKREQLLRQYKASDANISDFMVAKERVEYSLEIL